MGAESHIEKTVCHYAKSLGWSNRKFTTPGRRGTSDRLFFKYCRQIIFIEFKAPGKIATKRQKYELGLYKKAGFSVFSIDNIESGKQVFDEYESNT